MAGPFAHAALCMQTRCIQACCLVFALVGTALPGCGSSDTSSPATAGTTASPASDKNPVTDPQTPVIDRKEVISRSDDQVARQDFAAAAADLKKLLVVDPMDVEVLFRLANVMAMSGDLPKAIDLLSAIPDDHPQAGLPALGQSADWCLQLERYDQAEQLYLKVLALAPQAAPALRQLAYILNRQGRRHEAAVHIRELCKMGDILIDELNSLVALSDAIYNDPSNPESIRAGQRAYWPIGAMGLARKQYDDEEFSEVVNLLHESVADGTARPAAVALYGLAVAETQDEARFQLWLSRTNDQTRQFAEYWSALGAYLLDQKEFQQAARALVEAIDRDPTDLSSLARLRNALLAMKQDEAAQRVIDRWRRVRESLRANNRIAATHPPEPDAIAELVSILGELDRPLEAVLWKAIEQHFRGAPKSEQIALKTEQQQLVASGQMFPLLEQRLCGLDREQYPMPKLDAVARPAPPIARANGRQATFTPAMLVNAAEQIGLNHTYRVASQPVELGFAVYQILGGGVVVFDYDLDGNTDLYFAQGGADPPEFRGNQTNQLYRNTDSTLVDVTQFASASEFQYTIGVAAGDWNQDGFPDLVVTSIGVDVLLVNNGDGTFTRNSLTKSVNKNRVPSSVAMADLTGDGLPDIYQANYVDDQRMVLKPPTNDLGQPLLPVLPSKYAPGADRLLVNDKTGGFSPSRLTSDPADNSTSLGLVIANFDDEPGLEIFVANDMDANQLWSQTVSKQWVDVALLRGCAFSYTGAATASMGVASGDFDNNGRLDLHVTNYQDENASLFLNNGGSFQDRSLQYQIAAASRDVLGFGTQAIDYDNSGRRDLVVANGHIEDAVENNSAFRQFPQLFCNLGDRFQIADVTDASNYWNSRHLGRAMATLDFDRDGRTDLVITHIEEPSALLLNQTPTDHHWLQIQLVGTNSERDGTGARIRLRLGQREMTDWAIAGDGYLCHNENIVSFGTGMETSIDELVVDWPSGDQQVFHGIPADQRLLILENQDEPFTLFSNK